jgi:hypothetical protein
LDFWEAVGVTILLGPLLTTVINLLYAMARAGIQDLTSRGARSRGEAEMSAKPGTATLLGAIARLRLVERDHDGLARVRY